MPHLRIATRASALAQVQARRVGDALAEKNPGLTYDLHFVTTTGDKFMGDLSKVGGKGAFVKEIEDALLKQEADIAVHSMKDVPGELPAGLHIPAMLARNDLRDVIVCRTGETFLQLPHGARIGTSSLRRAAQLRSAFPYLTVVPLRGNVDSRLKKLDAREVDALVLAKAGLELLGAHARISDVLEPDMMCPAVGQGAIGVECRQNDAATNALLATISDADTVTCVNAERELLRTLGGSCHTPIAGFCQVTKGGNLRLIALVASLDGRTVLRARHKMTRDEAVVLGRAAGDDLLAQGAADIIRAAEAERASA